MFRALAAWHWRVLSLASAAVWAELVVGSCAAVGLLTNWLSIAWYRPSWADVSGGIPLAARMRLRVTLVRPCCSAVAFADA